MSSTPTNQDSKPMSPPKTMGWGKALFGGGWLSSKKPSNVASSTGSTASKSKNPHRSPKPLHDLDGFNTMHSPEQSMLSPVNNNTGVSTAASSLPLQQLPKKTPSKSPWTSSKAPQFSVGNLKPTASRIGTTRTNRTSFNVSASSRVAPANRPRRRNTYKTSGVFQVRRNNRGKKAPIDKAQMNVFLMNSRPAIEAPSQKKESDKNFRTAFKKKVKPGARLYPSNGGRGRLPNQERTGSDTTKFLTNGKRNLDSEDDKETVENKTISKKRRVNFGIEEKNATAMPIENFVSTPAKDLGSKFSSKRKATPFKPAMQPVNGIDENEKDQEMAPASDRRIRKVRRSPPSKKPEMGFSEMPKVSLNGDSWVEEEESYPMRKSSMMIDSNFMTGFNPKEAVTSDSMPNGLPQFEQKPLFVGEKQDRAVPDDDDDSEDEMEPKRTKTAASSNEKLGASAWGDTFKHLYAGKIRCDACGVYNEKSATKCVSCEASLSSAGSDKKSEPAKASKPAVSGSIGSSGFSFGGGGSLVAPAPSSTVGAFKFSAAPAASPAPAAGGFKFGASTAAAPSPGAGGFKFGGSSTNTAKEPSATATSSSGGFTFGASATSKSSSSTTKSSAPSGEAESSSTTGGFQFGGAAKSKSPTASASSSSAPSGGFKFGSSEKPKTSKTTDSAPASSKPKFSFGSSSAAPASSSSSKTGEAPTASAPSASGLFGNFAASSSSSSSTPAPKFKFGASTDTNSVAKRGAAEVSTTEPAQKRKNMGGDNGGGFSFGSSSEKNKESKQDVSSFSFGSSAPTATTAKAPTPGFSFGSSSDTTAAAPADSSAAPKFSFGAGPSSTAAPSLGSIPTDDGSTKKKRRSRDDDNTASSSQPTMSFGSKPSSEAPSAGAPAPFSFGKSSTADTPAPAPAPMFGSTPAPAPAAQVPSFSFGSTPAPAAAAATPAAPSFSFGSTPTPAPAQTPAATPSFQFGATTTPAPPAPAPAPFSFGAAPPAPGFGSTAPAPAPMAFGSTPSAAPNTGFGSTPAPSMNFGSTTPAPSTTFGSTPAAPPAFGAPAGGMNFGSSTPAAAPVPFGSAAAPVPFGSTPAAPQPFGSSATTFGSSQAAAPPMAPGGFGGGGFGATTPQPPAPQGGGFSLGTGGGSSRTPGRGRSGRRIVRARRPAR